MSFWDLRAKKVVYELATGNNGVISMAWDSLNTTLYAATTCDYMDGRGYHYGYRPLKQSKLRGINDDHRTELENDFIMGSDGEGDIDWDDDDDEDVCWPEDAVHSEDYFGYAFDSGDHRLCASSSFH